MTAKDTERRAGLLFYAASHNYASVVQALLELRVDVDAQDGTKYMRTALWEAASQGHANILEMLIKAGADVSACSGPASHAGRSPLSMARHRSMHNAAQVLLALWRHRARC